MRRDARCAPCHWQGCVKRPKWSIKLSIWFDFVFLGDMLEAENGGADMLELARFAGEQYRQ
jgi:hypothetical protein